MAAEQNIVQTFTDKRLSITREAELLQSYVRINSDQDDDNSNRETEPDENGKCDKADINVADVDVKPKSTSQTPAPSRKPSKQLTKEVIKKKGKRRKKRNGRQEELYCDKDRAAAVNMGSKDIKQSLKLKRKQDRSKALQIPEEAEPATFLALGNYKMCRGDLQIAIDFMTKALELNPSEKNALVARSKCYILLGQPENALKDAETALQIDKSFLKAIYQKAESLYYLGNFEYSLVYYHRGLHIRPDHEGFKLGVHNAQKAIENAIGSSFGGVLSRYSSRGTVTRSKRTDNSSNTTISSKSTTARESSNNVDDSNNNNNSGSGSNSNKSKVGVRMTSLGKPKVSRKNRMLRELAPDKEYLDNLMHNPNIKCKFAENDCRIETCIKDTVKFLNERQEFWRQQLPAKLK